MDINQGIFYLYSDDEKGFWNNESGWGAFETAQEYLEEDLGTMVLKGSRFVSASEAETLCDDPLEAN
jgi:hypothetical protein